MAVEAIVGPGEVAADSEEADATVVELVVDPVDLLAVAHEGVEGAGEAEAEDGAEEEGDEGDPVVRGQVPGQGGQEEEGDGCQEEGEAAQEVAPGEGGKGVRAGVQEQN